MNKSAIQKYAIWARNELIEQVKQRAFQYGINEMGFGDENASVVAGRVLSNEEKRQRRQFIEVIKRSTYQQTIEEVAYTWFNRFIALRYMEVNDYLPTHVRVFSDTNGNLKPEILSNVLHIDLPGLDKDKVSEFLNNNQTQELYRYLLLTQCNALNELLPEMFERLGAYTEMLLPNNILKPDGVIGRLVIDIPEEDFKDAVQIIGWMYQYYNTEPKQEVFDGLKQNIKITKEKIPAATQLFTPDWIVHYMVENSLGRLWLESHPNSKLRDGWKYYVDEAEQTPEVANRLRILRTENAIKSPEDIKFIDPCMGSGHILVYAFDILMQIYTSEGYSERDAAQLILEKNLFGLDIDRRAYQLSYFALMMKARQYNRRILSLEVNPQVYEPTGSPEAMEFGSLIKVEELEPRPEKSKDYQSNLFDDDYETKLNSWNFRRLLSQRYDVVVTNPPYMGTKGMSEVLSKYIANHYPNSKSDLFSVFIERCDELVKINRFKAMITQHSWMFLTSFEKLRLSVLQNTIINMLHLGSKAFEEIGGEVVQTTTWVDQKVQLSYKGKYYRLVKYGSEKMKKKGFLSQNDIYVANSINFNKIPGSPIAYWASNELLNVFRLTPFYDFTISDGKNVTGNNDKFLRFFWEVNYNDFGINKKWLAYAKGGSPRKWYGNFDYVINWSTEARKFYRSDKVSRIIPEYLWYRIGITWTLISSGKPSFRIKPSESTFDGGGLTIFIKDESYFNYFLSMLNSNVFIEIQKLLNPTLNLLIKDIRSIPMKIDNSHKSVIDRICEENISISRVDWDSFETSWDFKYHPLICGESLVESAFTKWKKESTSRFNRLKSNEEELNRIFIEIYELQEELTPKVENNEVTMRLADMRREICSLISYAVGCMFGRYSLDAEGLVYAGGEWDVNKYQKFSVDKDNIIPILDDEYFEDDIVGRFVLFIKTVYGDYNLEENLKFIADALGGKGTSREIIRNYFINDFYADHLKIYQKRPIYWMFDSGKKNGFKALIYMHRYSRDLLAKLRTDYVHEQQERYRTQLSRISTELNHALGTERSKLLKQQDKLTEQLKEITVFEEKVHHLADQHIEIDLDDGVKKNYALFEDVLAKI